MKTNSKGIFFTANEREKERIKKNAAKCGLNTSEYLRQRALGYAPKAVLPDAFFHFCEKLDRLWQQSFWNRPSSSLVYPEAGWTVKSPKENHSSSQQFRRRKPNRALKR